MRTRTPRVLIGIPTFQRSGLLREAIQSVLDQTDGDFVLEISDNASTDGTPQTVASFDDPRIVYRRQAENVGLVANHNSFLTNRETHSDYVLVLCDDDKLYPRFLEKAVKALDDYPRAGMVHTAFDQVTGDGQVIGIGNWTGNLSRTTIEPHDDFLRASMKWSCRVCGSTGLVRTAAIPQGGLRQNESPASDFGLWLRVAGAGWDSIFLAERLAAYRVHADSESAQHFGTPQPGGYTFDLAMVDRLKELKLRFVSEYRSQIENPDELERLVRWGANYGVLSVLRRARLEGERARFARAKFIAAAAAVDRKLLLDDLLWRYVAADLLKPVFRRST
jgi:glycosyltransferase involved in cell wall biosynthesis